MRSTIDCVSQTSWLAPTTAVPLVAHRYLRAARMASVLRLALMSWLVWELPTTARCLLTFNSFP